MGARRRDQLALDVDVPRVPAPERPRSPRKPPLWPTAEQIEARIERCRRESALVEQLDGRGTVVAIARWRDERRAAA